MLWLMSVTGIFTKYPIVGVNLSSNPHLLNGNKL
jgi:hypothetical protein